MLHIHTIDSCTIRYCVLPQPIVNLPYSHDTSIYTQIQPNPPEHPNNPPRAVLFSRLLKRQIAAHYSNSLSGQLSKKLFICVVSSIHARLPTTHFDLIVVFKTTFLINEPLKKLPKVKFVTIKLFYRPPVLINDASQLQMKSRLLPRSQHRQYL